MTYDADHVLGYGDVLILGKVFVEDNRLEQTEHVLEVSIVIIFILIVSQTVPQLAHRCRNGEQHFEELT